MEEYNGIFSDCHAGNDYAGDCVTLESSGKGNDVQAAQRRYASMLRSQRIELAHVSAHDSGNCLPRCYVCRKYGKGN